MILEMLKATCIISILLDFNYIVHAYEIPMQKMKQREKEEIVNMIIISIFTKNLIKSLSSCIATLC